MTTNEETNNAFFKLGGLVAENHEKIRSLEEQLRATSAQLIESRAREAVLREALRQSEFLSQPGHHNDNRLSINVICKEALSQTIPNGFAQRVAAVLFVAETEVNFAYCENMALRDALDTLTPEDIALLETMKGGV